MSHYEITFIVSGQQTEATVSKTTKKLADLVDELKGRILAGHPWGLLELAYPIGKERTGYYFTYLLDLPTEKVARFIDEIKILPHVLRHILISLEKEGVSLEEAMQMKGLKAQKETLPLAAPSRMESKEETVPAVAKGLKPKRTT